VWVRTESSWLKIGIGDGTCECVTEPSGSIKELTASKFYIFSGFLLVIDSFLS